MSVVSVVDDEEPVAVGAVFEVVILVAEAAVAIVPVEPLTVALVA